MSSLHGLHCSGQNYLCCWKNKGGHDWFLAGFCWW